MRSIEKTSITFCPFCKESIAALDAIFCSSCLTEHHILCWQENHHRCSIFSCNGIQTLHSREPIHFPLRALILACLSIALLLTFAFWPYLLIVPWLCAIGVILAATLTDQLRL